MQVCSVVGTQLHAYEMLRQGIEKLAFVASSVLKVLRVDKHVGCQWIYKSAIIFGEENLRKGKSDWQEDWVMGVTESIAWLSFLGKENELLEGVDMKNKRDTKRKSGGEKGGIETERRKEGT